MAEPPLRADPDDAESAAPRWGRVSREAEVWLTPAATAPAPVALALHKLVGAKDAREARDHAVSVFRAVVRVLSSIALAVRAHRGPGPGETREASMLLLSLRRRGLTDGQHVALFRTLTRPWQAERERHPVPALLALARRSSTLLDALDELLVMRNRETVAHGPAAPLAEVEAQLAKRLPALHAAVDALVLALSGTKVVARAGDAYELVGPTPRPVVAPELAEGEVWLTDVRGEPLLSLSPVCLARRPFAGGDPALFVLDGNERRGASYVAFPSGNTHLAPAGWAELDRLLATRTDEEAAKEAALSRPYRGLSPFRSEDRELFFGRELEGEALANRIRVSPIVTITGPSGAGKSSLVLAGAVPRLPELEPIVLSPSRSPARRIAERLSRLSGDLASLDLVEEALLSRPAAIARALTRFVAQSDRTPLVVVDQAEELLTLAKPEERDPVTEFLAALAEDGGRVVLIVREDFFARLVVQGGLRGRAASAVEVLAPPDREALLRALVAPARAFGYAWDDGLAEELLDEAGATDAPLAVLQFTADRLWDARDPTWKRLLRSAYREMGGAFGAMARHAERTYAQLSPGERRVADALLGRLLTSQGTRDVLSRDEALSGLGPGADDVLARLVDARLVSTREGARGEALVELVHEALLAHWPRLGELGRRRRADDELALHLERLAKAWDARDRPRDLALRGGMLLDARALSPSLSPLAASFVEASSRQATRERRVGRAAVGGALLALSVATAAFGVEWRIAARETERVQALARAEERAKWRSLARERERDGRPHEALAMLVAAGALGDREAAADLDRLSDVTVLVLPRKDVTRVVSLDATTLTLEGDDGLGTHALPTLERRATEHPEPLPEVGREVDDRGFRARAVGRTLELSREGTTVLLTPHDRPTARVTLALGGLVTFAVDGEVKLWTLEGREVRPLLPRGAALVSVVRSGDALAVARSDGVFVLRPSPARPRLAVRHAAGPAVLGFVDGALVSASSALVATASGGTRRSALSGEALALASAPSGLVVGGRDGVVSLVRPGEPPRTLGTHAGYVTDVLAERGRIISAGTDRVVRVVEGDGARALRVGGAPVRLALVDDRLLVATDDDRVTGLDLATGEPAFSIELALGHARATARAATGVVVGDLTGRVSLVRADGTITVLSATPGPAVRCAATALDGGVLVGRDDGSVALFAEGRVTPLGRLGGAITACALGPGEALFGAESGEVRATARTGELLRAWAHAGRITQVALRVGGREAAGASKDGEVSVVDLAAPAFDPRAATNLRVCEKDGSLSPLVPFDPGRSFGCP